MSTDVAAQVAEHLHQMDDLRESLEAQFSAVAQGKPWFEGTGNDDPIFPWQWQGACFGAVAERWFCGDEVGLGKTRTATAWLDLIDARKVIVMTEANLVNQFAGEVSEIAPHRNIVVLSKLEKETRDDRVVQLLKMDSAIVFINYEIFRRDAALLNKLLLWRADSIIIDEAHNMKTIKTSNFKNAQKMLMGDNTCPDCGALIMGTARPCGSCGWKKDWLRPDSLEQLLSTKSAKRVLLMTGTPILNSPVDLFSLLHLLDPVTFPSMVRFKKTYLLMNHHSGRHEFKRNGLDDLKPYIEDRYLARTKDDVGLELPTRRIHIERVDLDPAEYPLQARTIEQVTKTAQIILSSGQTMTLFDILTILLRKRQAGVWPGGIEMKDLDGNVIFSVGSEVRESVKFDRALERVQEYHALGRRQVVFSQFRTVLVEFEDRLTKAGLRVARMDGSTPEGKRNEIRTNFYRAKGEEPKWDIVLCHYKTGGAGLNLTSATVTHILDEEWNAGKRDQAYGRSHRLGQTEETDIHVYRIPGTVDTFMANLISLKEKLANDFKQTMTNDELMSRLTEAIRRGEA